MTQTPASSTSRASTNGASPPRRTRRTAKRPSRARSAGARAPSRAPSRFASLRWLFAETPAAPVILGNALRYVSRRPVRFIGLALVAAGAAWLLRNQYADSADSIDDEAIAEDDTTDADPTSEGIDP